MINNWGQQAYSRRRRPIYAGGVPRPLYWTVCLDTILELLLVVLQYFLRTSTSYCCNWLDESPDHHSLLTGRVFGKAIRRTSCVDKSLGKSNSIQGQLLTGFECSNNAQGLAEQRRSVFSYFCRQPSPVSCEAFREGGCTYEKLQYVSYHVSGINMMLNRLVRGHRTGSNNSGAGD